LKVVVLGNNVRFSESTFGYSVYYGYLYNGSKAGTYTYLDFYGKQGEKGGIFEYISTMYGLVITQYNGDEHDLQEIPRQLDGMEVIGVGGTFARKYAHRLELPDGVTYIDKEFQDDILKTRTLRGKIIPPDRDQKLILPPEFDSE
jgi:hypothetical protein